MIFTSIHLTLKEASELIGVLFRNVKDDLTPTISDTEHGIHLMDLKSIKDEYGSFFTPYEESLVPEIIQHSIASAQAKVFRIYDVDGKIRYLRSCYSHLVPKFKHRFELEHEGEIHEFCDLGGIGEFFITSNSTVRITFHNPNVFFNYMIFRLGAKGYFMTEEMAENPHSVLEYAKLFLEHSFNIFRIPLPPMIPLDDRRKVSGQAFVELKRLIQTMPFDHIIRIVEDYALRTRDVYMAVVMASEVFGYTERRITMGLEERPNKRSSYSNPRSSFA